MVATRRQPSAIAQGAARLRQLEELREQQVISEQYLEAALEEASGQLRRLQESNARSVEAAERELRLLAQSLQASLCAQSGFEERLRATDEEAVELAMRRSRLEESHQRTECEMQKAEVELQAWDATLMAKRTEKEHFLQALHEQLQENVKLEEEFRESAREKDALQDVVDKLRLEDARACRLERAEDLLPARRRFWLLQRTFTWFAVGAMTARQHRVRQDAFELRLKHDGGRAILRLWRRHTRTLRQLRLWQEAQTRCIAPRVLKLWSLWIRESRWLQQQTPLADALRRCSLLHTGVACWCKGIQAAVAAQFSPARRKLKIRCFHAWWRESARSWESRWREARIARRGSWRRLLRNFRGWDLAVRRAARARRFALEIQCSIATHRVQSALHRWRRKGRHSAGARALMRRHIISVMQAQMRWWKRFAHLQLQRDALCDRKVQTLLSRSLRHLARATALQQRSRGMRDRVMRREGRVRVTMMLQAWCRYVSQLGQLQVKSLVLSSRRVWQSIWQWHSWARRTQFHRLVIANKSRSAHQQALKMWRVRTRRSRVLGLRLNSIMRRHNLTLCKAMWSGLLRAWHHALKHRRAQLAQAVCEKQVTIAEIESELEASHATWSNAELVQLQLMDELHAVAETAAAVTVEHREAEGTRETVEQTIATEHNEAVKLHSEAADLHEELRTLSRLREEQETLQEDLVLAEQGPARLKEEVEESDYQAKLAVSKENEAQHAISMLHSELKDMHRTTTWELQRRDSEAAVLQAELDRARSGAAELEQAAEMEQLQLWAQEAKLEMRRGEDLAFELELSTCT